MIPECTFTGCEKPENRDGLCLRHKLLKVYVATVPGGSRDANNKISYGREVEANLSRYEQRKRSGDNPSGTTRKSRILDARKRMLWEKHGDTITDDNPPETVKKVRKSLLGE